MSIQSSEPGTRRSVSSDVSLTARLSDPALYTIGGDVKGLMAELEEAKEEVTLLMARWEELESVRSGSGG